MPFPWCLSRKHPDKIKQKHQVRRDIKLEKRIRLQNGAVLNGWSGSATLLVDPVEDPTASNPHQRRRDANNTPLPPPFLSLFPLSLSPALWPSHRFASSARFLYDYKRSILSPPFLTFRPPSPPFMFLCFQQTWTAASLFILSFAPFATRDGL